jgi:hypothetical protein
MARTYAKYKCRVSNRFRILLQVGAKRMVTAVLFNSLGKTVEEHHLMRLEIRMEIDFLGSLTSLLLHPLAADPFIGAAFSTPDILPVPKSCSVWIPT